MRDYKDVATQPAKPDAVSGIFATGRYRWLAGGILVPLIALAVFLPGDDDEAATAEETTAVAEPVAAPETTSVAEAVVAENAPEDALKTTTITLPDAKPVSDAAPQTVSRDLSLPPAAATEPKPAPAEPLDLTPLLLAQKNHQKNHTAETPVVPLSPDYENNAGERLMLTVKSGDTLDKLFRRNNLSIQDLHNIMRLQEAKNNLRTIRPGDELVVFHEEGSITAIHREVSLWDTIVVTRENDAYTAELVKNAIEVRLVEASGRITDALWNAGKTAGLPDNIIMELSGVFSWDIDFALDIRDGDEFVVIYEELWRDGENIRPGEIIAAEFINRGDSFQAIRYEDPNGRVNYYSPDGKNMRKAFLRVPLDVFRVSSRFNPNRRHPVLNTIRAHKGVDYAAPRGTPIKATGDGKVSFRGVKGGYGNTVILSHGDNITTLYAHMDKFSRAARSGSRVKQGQIIGYVGSSGLATGPHLHYEYRKDGVHRNPSTVKLPAGQPINKAYLADFQQTAAPLLEQLNNQRQLLASNDND